MLAGVTTVGAQQMAGSDTSRGPSARVCVGGDVTLGTNLDTAWVRRVSRETGRRGRARPEPDSLVAPLRAMAAGADLVLLNLEGAIGEGPAPPKCKPTSTACYAFRQPVAAARALRTVSTASVMVNVANNHSTDAGPEGLVATLEHLAAADVMVTGADTLATIAVVSSGDTVAVLGFSTSSGPDPRDLAAVRRHVARAATRTPLVVVTMHMGAEGPLAQRTRDTTEIFLGMDRGNSVAFARAAAESGAKFIVGHGPHVMRAAEWWGAALIVYSVGNLLTYGPFSLREPMNRGALACATLTRTGVERPELRPTVQRAAGVVRPDLTSRALVLVDSLSRLDFPRTRATVMPAALLERAVTPATPR